MRYYLLLIFIVLAAPVFVCAQGIESAPKTTTRTAEDSMVTIEILPGVRKLEFRKVNDSTTLQILAGNVKLKQGSALFDCDSCVINNYENTFEAWGHVHINDSDTTNVYSDHLRYLIRKKIAYLDGGVKLTDGKGTLTTPDLEYDMDTKIGIYKHGGTVTNKKSVLTSTEGYYFADLKDVYFKKNVEMNDPANYMKTDSLLYNTETSTARFIAQTFIRDSSGRTIETSEGYYNTQTGKAEFAGRPVIRDKKVTMIANIFRTDDSTGVAQAKGNAIIIDSTNSTTILAGTIYRNKKTEAILAIDKPLMIRKEDKDSIFIRADTFFSAKLSDLRAFQKAQADSNRRVLEAQMKISDSIRVADSTKRLLSDSLRHADSLNISKEPVADSSKAIVADTIAALPVNKEQEIVADTIKAVIDTSAIVKAVVDTSANLKSAIDTSAIVVEGTKINDSLHLARADTLIANDSTDRYFEAYHNVKIFTDSMQAVCDSLFYSAQDSTFRLYQDPVVWSNNSQITGDTMYLFTKDRKADRVKVFNHSFMVNIVKPEIFNQVKSSRMDGYFTDGNLDSLRCNGLAECIYFIQDEDSAFTGINESKSDILDFYFAKKELRKVVFRSSVSGTLWPMHQKSPSEMRLTGFQWLGDRRPKSKFELME